MQVVHCDVAQPRSGVAEAETHVYSCPIDASPLLVAALTDEERTRAERFSLPRVREQFTVARGRLRLLLAHYLERPPQAVPLCCDDHGKPQLPPEFPLHFNLSHSDGLAVFALSRQRVGVDVERERVVPDADSLVARFFTPRECTEFAALPAADRPLAFLRAWTRKEAVLKALGHGIRALDICEVTFGAAPAVNFLKYAAAEDWHLDEWTPQRGYLAAIAIERPKRC